MKKKLTINVKHSAEKNSINECEMHCWEFVGCAESIRTKCPVYQDKSYTCWEYDTTRCKELLAYTYDCKNCRYYLSKTSSKECMQKGVSLKTNDQE